MFVTDLSQICHGAAFKLPSALMLSRTNSSLSTIRIQIQCFAHWALHCIKYFVYLFCANRIAEEYLCFSNFDGTASWGISFLVVCLVCHCHLSTFIFQFSSNSNHCCKCMYNCTLILLCACGRFCCLFFRLYIILHFMWWRLDVWSVLFACFRLAKLET